jgi:hypothetical protein
MLIGSPNAIIGEHRWRKKMSKYSEYEYRKQPGFDMNTFEGASRAIP